MLRRFLANGKSLWMLAGLLAVSSLGAAGRRLLKHEPEPLVRSVSKSVKQGHKLHTGTQVIAYMIGSATCGASNDSGMPGAIVAIQNQWRTAARQAHKSFTSVGVAIDWDPTAGLGFLNRLGAFDEISLGSNWGNSLVVHYMQRDLAGPVSIPQLVVIERDVTISQRSIEFGEDRIVARKIGVDEIKDYAAQLSKSSGISVVTERSR